MLARRPALAYALIAAWLAFSAATVINARPASAATSIKGSGSSWVALAIDQWVSDLRQQGLLIDYNTTSSGGGRQDYYNNAVDYAATELPFQPAELPSVHRSYQYLPDVAGGTSMMYNLHKPDGSRITNLNINADVAAKIFTGKLTSWHDGEISALNPGLSIAETDIKPTVRSDAGSGTMGQFSLYLGDQAPGPWGNFCQLPCQQWPPDSVFVAQQGSDGIANFVASDVAGRGAIGIVEAGWAQSRGFPVANLGNASGHFTQPDANNVATALTHALLHTDLTQDLTQVYRAPEANAYAMSSYSYLLSPCAGSVSTCVGPGIDAAKGALLGQFITYIACAGQREAGPLRYSPIPPNLIKDDFDAVRRIPGAAAPPPIDAQHCPNPWVTGTFGSNLGQGSTSDNGSPGANNGNGASTGSGATPTADPSAASSGPGGAIAAVIASPKARQAAYAAARRTAATIGLASATPLYEAVAVLLLLVFAPVGGRRLVLYARRFRRQRPLAPEEGDRRG